LLAHCCKVDKSARDIGTEQFHGDMVTHIEALESADDSALGRRPVPLSEAPVTMASNRAPIREVRSSAAADFPTCRSTFAALSSCSVQWRASVVSSSLVYCDGCPASADFNRR